MNKKTSKIYRLAGNDWYAVMEDDDKVMLVDTDCKIGDEELKTPWSDGDWLSEDGKNGQAILDYVNRIADKYFSNIKHAIEARTVEACTYKLEDAYMWPMSKEEFDGNKVISKKIAENSCGFVRTRTFSRVYCGVHFAWYINRDNGDGREALGGIVSSTCRVAPAFYLRKSAIDHITDDGEIVLKPAEQK